MVRMEKQWLKQHVVSFIFVIDEFQPNPDSELFELMQTGKFNKPASVEMAGQNALPATSQEMAAAASTEQ